MELDVALIIARHEMKRRSRANTLRVCDQLWWLLQTSIYYLYHPEKDAITSIISEEFRDLCLSPSD